MGEDAVNKKPASKSGRAAEWWACRDVSHCHALAHFPATKSQHRFTAACWSTYAMSSCRQSSTALLAPRRAVDSLVSQCKTLRANRTLLPGKLPTQTKRGRHLVPNGQGESLWCVALLCVFA